VQDFSGIDVAAVAQSVQIAFYVVVATVAVLTYRSARRGLLNTVRTEYVKRVMDRLTEVSAELASEFDPDSPHYWVGNRFAHELLEEVHEEYSAIGREEYAKRMTFDGGFRGTSEQRRMRVFLARVQTDPFIPRDTRAKIVAYLERRLQLTTDIYWEMVNKYRRYLAEKQPELDQLKENHDWFHNWIVAEEHRQGIGVEHIEKQIAELREAIQDYFESFNPERTRRTA
jgi:hypothetical protein